MAKKKATRRVVHSDGTESALERLFQAYWLSLYPRHPPIPQIKFHPKRNWLFDFAWPFKKIAVEVQGMGPGHCGIVAMTRDYDKHRAAMLLNWQIVYLTKKHLSPEKIGDVCHDIAKLLDIFEPPSTVYVPIHKRK